MSILKTLVGGKLKTWLQGQGYQTERDYWADKGGSVGSIYDNAHSYLRSLGYSGELRDMLRSWAQAEGGPGTLVDGLNALMQKPGTEELSPYALDFNGVTGEVDVTSSATVDFNGASTYTWECRFKADSDGLGDSGRIFQKVDAGLVAIVNETGGNVGVDAVIGTTGADPYARSPSNLALTSEHIIHVVYNEDSDNRFKIYHNGTLQSLTSDDAGVGAIIDDSGQDLTIGNNAAGTRTMDGYIRDLRFYKDKALTAQECSDRANQNTISGKTSHWDFLEGSGTTLGDNVSSDDGTITTASWVTL